MGNGEGCLRQGSDKTRSFTNRGVVGQVCGKNRHQLLFKVSFQRLVKCSHSLEAPGR